MASEPTVTREMAEAAWRYLWSQKRWAVEDVQEAIRHAFVVLERTHVVVPKLEISQHPRRTSHEQKLA